MGDEERTYRVFGPDGSGLTAFRIKVETTDLYIKAESDLSGEALKLAAAARKTISDHAGERPEFLTALTPLEIPGECADFLLASMYRAGIAADVGPMAAVAGAVARYVAEGLKPFTRRVLVENGGDLYIDDEIPVSVGIFAGKSPFTGRLAIELEAERLPVSVCTSSGTVGPSLSFGKADAATVIAGDAALADAVATALGNRIKTPGDIKTALAWAMGVPGVEGALAIIGGSMGCLGDVKLAKTER